MKWLSLRRNGYYVFIIIKSIECRKLRELSAQRLDRMGCRAMPCLTLPYLPCVFYLVSHCSHWLPLFIRHTFGTWSCPILLIMNRQLYCTALTRGKERYLKPCLSQESDQKSSQAGQSEPAPHTYHIYWHIKCSINKFAFHNIYKIALNPVHNETAMEAKELWPVDQRIKYKYLNFVLISFNVKTTLNSYALQQVSMETRPAQDMSIGIHYIVFGQPLNCIFVA